MKIVYITNARLPTEKAHGVQILKMIQAFSGLGHKTTLIHPKRFQKEISHKKSVYEFYGLEKLFDVKSINFIDPYIFRSFMPKFIYRLLSFIVDLIWGVVSVINLKKLNPDFLMFRDNTPFSLFFSSFMSIPCVIEFHNMPPFISKRIFKLVLNRSNKIICFGITKNLSSDLEDYFNLNKGSVKTIHDAVDIDQFKNDPVIKKNSKEPIITYCGSLSMEKGTDLIIETANKLKDFKINIVGGLDSSVKKYSSKSNLIQANNIKFIGQVLPTKVPSLLFKSDILLLPSSAFTKKSNEYTSAMKMFEYLATGIPIVASNIPSNSEILTTGVNAVLFNPDDSSSLEKEIRNLWENYELRKSISKNSIQLSLQYTWTKRCRIIEHEVQKLI